MPMLKSSPFQVTFLSGDVQLFQHSLPQTSSVGGRKAPNPRFAQAKSPIAFFCFSPGGGGQRAKICVMTLMLLLKWPRTPFRRGAPGIWDGLACTAVAALHQLCPTAWQSWSGSGTAALSTFSRSFHTRAWAAPLENQG